MKDKNTLNDAVALWHIGRTLANAMGAEYCRRYAENGFTAPFTREMFLRGVMAVDFPAKEEFPDAEAA